MILYIILGLICIPIFLNLYGKRFNSPFTFGMIVGLKGQGKSSYQTKEILRHMKKGYICYTDDVTCCIPGVRIFDIKDLGNYKPEANSFVCVSEGKMAFDSRNFAKFLESTRDLFVLQRHYKFKCLMASQGDNVDKTLRDLADYYIIQHKYFGFLGVGKVVTKWWGVREASDLQEAGLAVQLKMTSFLSWKYTWIPKYVKYFNSFQTPYLPELRYHYPEMPYEKKRIGWKRKSKSESGLDEQPIIDNVDITQYLDISAEVEKGADLPTL